MEGNELIRFEAGLVKRVGNVISITNKLLTGSINHSGIIFIGNNEKHIVILLKDVSEDYINSKTLEFLTMILKSCQLEMKDVAVLNILKGEINIDRLIELFSPDVILLFDVDNTEIQLPFSLSINAPAIYDYSKILLAPSLVSLLENTEAKLALWKSLKSVFNI